LVLVAGCEQPRTELVVRTESEVPWGTGQTVQSVVLSVRRSGAAGPLRSARTTALGTEPGRLTLPLLVGVVPGDDDDTDTPLWIEALGCGSPNGCTASDAVVAQRAVVRFVRGETQELTLLLASACLNMRCPSDQRCAVATGECEAATRAQETVRPFTGTDAATTPPDAPLTADRPSTMDAAVDAPAVDAPSTDRGNPTDRGVPMDVVPRDVQTTDTGAIDAGRADTVAVDAGRPDVGTVDAGRPDTGAIDAGRPDAGTVDVGGPTDVGITDRGPVDTGATDVGTPCATGLTRCGGVCVNTEASDAHCGACGRLCGSSQWCSAGVCGGGSRYTVTTPSSASVPFVDACAITGAVTILESADDEAEAVALPFATRWWGSLVAAGTSMAVTANGVVHVGGASGLFSRFEMIPSTTAPNSVIAAQWRDLYTSPEGVCVATVGSAPARRWIAQWVDTGVLGAASSLNFEIVVHESTGVIDFVYATMTGAGGASVGLENPAGTDAVRGCGTALCTINSDSRLRFTPSD